LATKTLQGRIVNKHDSAANWAQAVNFRPMQGELIIYDPDETCSYERFKIGDGVQNVNALPFATDGFVSYNEQTLTDEQKAQARANINANGLDWHKTDPSSDYTSYIANFGNIGNITDWNNITSVVDPTTLSTTALNGAATYISLLLKGTDKKINKAHIAKQMPASVNALIDAGYITLPWSFAFIDNKLFSETNKVSYCTVTYRNGIWVLSNLLDRNQMFVIQADGSYSDGTLVYPDDTLSNSNRAADAKAVGDALALKIDKSEIAIDDEIIDMLAQEDMLPVVADIDGALLSDENENILLW
jgi:hypothetical protein